MRGNNTHNSNQFISIIIIIKTSERVFVCERDIDTKEYEIEKKRAGGDDDRNNRDTRERRERFRKLEMTF